MTYSTFTTHFYSQILGTRKQLAGKLPCCRRNLCPVYEKNSLSYCWRLKLRDHLYWCWVLENLGVSGKYIPDEPYDIHLAKNQRDWRAKVTIFAKFTSKNCVLISTFKVSLVFSKHTLNKRDTTKQKLSLEQERLPVSQLKFS